ncbi:MAG: hypothetical protein NUV52_01500, partial [Candidatus Roizmanbacteria bacterium]|nr:hypothetical protein [Candidatus Roizmanbacteria bacterium]
QNGAYSIASDCPFCPGNESQTPKEIDRIVGTDNAISQWLTRVIPNQYPITDIHEIIIHNPDHCKEIEDLSLFEMKQVMIMYQKRLQTLSNDGVPILFRNKGEIAGTSMPHPHSQIIVLPKQINLGALSLEPLHNIVYRNNYFVMYCPDFSQYPYEVWITHSRLIGIEIRSEVVSNVNFTAFTPEELEDLGAIMQELIRAMKKLLGDDFAYNYYISPYPPFYLRIIPRVLIRGGFELGTGLSTNTVDPRDAAEELKKYLTR